jgi:hypothetical protein
MRIFIVSNQQRGKGLVSIPIAGRALCVPVMNLPPLKVMMNFSIAITS